MYGIFPPPHAAYLSKQIPMKLLNKLDKYLIENHPLIWMTKLHYVLPISILVNLAFWIWGFTYVNLKVLRNRISEEIFIDSYAIYFYLLVAIMFLILWAIAYFKKSAVRHLYPIKKFYFTRLLILLFINFLLIVTPYLSFRSGINAKVGELANYNDLKKELTMVNRAQAFLPTDANDYDFKRLFELRNPGYQILPENAWAIGEVNTCDYAPFSHPENNDTLTNNNIIVQCLKTERTYIECDNTYSECFSGFRDVPQEYLDQTTTVNYLVDEFISFDDYNKEPSNSFYDYYFYYGDYSNGSLKFNDQIRKISKSRAKIKKELDQFEAFLNKYDVPHAFNSNVIAHYFSKYNGEFLNAFVDNGLKSYEYDDYYESNITGYGRAYTLAVEKRKEQSRNTTLADLEEYNGTDRFFMIDNSQLRNVFQNAKNCYYWKSFYIEAMIFLIIALGLAFLFLMFSFADFIILVVTIPVTGVLIIINVMLCVLLYSVVRNDDYLFFVPLSFATGIIIFYVLNLLKQQASRRITHSLGYLTGLISTVFLIGIAGLLVVLTKTDVQECDYYQTKYIFLKEWIEDPGFVFTLSAVGILLYTLTIKKLIAKPD